MTNEQIIDVLQALIDALKSDNPDTIRDVSKRVFASKAARGKGMAPKRERTSFKVDRIKIEEIYVRLSNAPSRGEGLDVLANAALNRVELVALSKLAKVYVTKADGVDRIEEKLVEAIIGTRLSSAAIRGEASNFN